MPQTASSSKWFFRVTLPHETTMTIWNGNWDTRENIFKSRLAQWDILRVIMVGHKGEKTEKEHFHALLELNEPIQQQSLNARIKLLFGVKGAQYSTKLWDGHMGIGAGSYLFHDPEHTILFNFGFEDIEIQHFKECNEQVREIVLDKKQKASGRCVDRVLEEIQKEGGKCWTRKRIILRLLEDIHSGVMYEPGDFVLKKYAEEIYMKQIQGKVAWEQYRNLRMSRLIWCNQTQEAEVEIFPEDI